MQIFVFKSVNIILQIGDLTQETSDAIVCPANSFGHMRGGVAGAIRECGGDIIEREAMSKAPIQVGSAVITTAGKLYSHHVIHVPTMKLPVQKSDVDSVRKAMRAALKIAEISNIQTISFPGMGTGTGWVNFDDASYAMLDEIKNHLLHEGSHLHKICILANSNAFYDSLINSATKIFTNHLREK